MMDDKMFFLLAGAEPTDDEMEEGADRIRALIQWIDQMPRDWDCWSDSAAECAVFALSNVGVAARHLLNETLTDYGFEAIPEPDQ